MSNFVGTGVTPAALIVAKASPGFLRSVYACNRNPANRYLMLFDASSAPSDASAIIGCPLLVPAGAGVFFDQAWFTHFGTTVHGLVLGMSTVPTAWTRATDADHDLWAIFQ